MRVMIMKKRIRKILLLGGWLFFPALALSAQDRSPGQTVASGVDRPDELKIKLAVIDPGKIIYSWFGHIALIVEEGKTKKLYDFGNFDINAPFFLGHYIQGDLRYFVAEYEGRRVDGYLFYYSQRENRSIRVYDLNLPREAKERIKNRLRENIKPENRFYQYLMLYDNCATRIRDILNDALKGRLQSTTDSVPITTARREIRRFSYRHFWGDWFTNYIMGSRSDQPFTAWEAMFLPENLERSLRQFSYPGPGGRDIPLITNPAVLYPAPREEPPVPLSFPPKWPKGLLLGLAFALCFFFLVRFYLEKKDPLSRFLLGAGSVLLNLFLGIFSTMVIYLTTFTRHDLLGNYSTNLWLGGGPLAFFLIVQNIRFILGKPRSWEHFYRGWLLMNGLALILILIWFLPVPLQRDYWTMSLVLPSFLVLGPVATLMQKHRSRKNRSA